MSDSNGRTAIIVALIGFVGTIAAAAISNWDKISPSLPRFIGGEPPQVQDKEPPQVPRDLVDSPRQAILDYYETINQGDYRQAWNMLIIDLQENKKVHPDGYYSFENWVKKITPITIKSVQVVKQSFSVAIVDLKYNAFINGKPLSMNLRYKLVWDELKQQWMVHSIEKIN